MSERARGARFTDVDEPDLAGELTAGPPVTPASPSARRGSFALRDRPGPVWLGLAAALALVHPWVPGSTWLLVHLVLLGALTHSAMVWSTHFTQALLKTPESLDNRTRQSRRIIVLSVGVCAVLVGVPSGWWPLTVAGATAVSAAVIWHGISLWQRLRRALPGRFRVTVRYYIAAAACVPVGATLGAWLARGLDDQRDGEVLVAHSMVMVLGWIGLTVTGTLITLWPTTLRTRMDARAERLARQALPVLLVGLAVLATGAALGSRAAALAGLGGYAAGLGWWGRALVAPARQAPPKAFATWSVSAALGWWVVALALLGWRLVTSASWAALADGYGTVAAVVVVGFAAQLLFGALSSLIPSVLGGGPSVVKVASAWLDRGAPWRVTVVNLGLLVCLLPVPSPVRATVSVLVLGALVAFLPLLLRSIGAAVAARRALLASVAEAAEHGGPPVPAVPVEAAPRRSRTQVLMAVASVAVAVILGIAADPAAAGLGMGPSAGGIVAGGGVAARAGVRPTGHTTRVTVQAHDMSYSLLLAHGPLRRPPRHRPRQPRRRVASRPHLRRRHPDRSGAARPVGHPRCPARRPVRHCCRGFRGPPRSPAAARRRTHPRRHAHHRGGRARRGPRRPPEALDLQRNRARPDAARTHR